MSGQKDALVVFFKLIGCGPCNSLFSGAWQQITSDPKNSNLKFLIYVVGRQINKETGEQEMFLLPDSHAGKVKGFPHVEIMPLDDWTKGVKYTGKRVAADMSKFFQDSLSLPQFRKDARSAPPSSGSMSHLATRKSTPAPLAVQKRSRAAPVKRGRRFRSDE